MKSKLILFFLAFPFLTQAQDISTLNVEWKIASVFEVETGMMSEEVGSLITKTNHQIEWQTWDGTTKQVFKINSTRGHWYNMKGYGSIIYDVVSGDQSGSILIEKNQSEWMARIMLVIEERPIVYELKLIDSQIL